MLHGRAVRSERAHARIVSVDTTAALDAAGVVAVMTAADLAGLFPRFGHLVADHPILAIDKVRYWGEPVALVLAETLDAAADGAELVRVAYEELPALMTPGEALAAGAPLIHEHAYEAGDSLLRRGAPGRDEPSNVAHSVDQGWGDVDAAMAVADVVVETTTHYPMLYAYAMEPYNAWPRSRDDGLEVWTTARSTRSWSARTWLACSRCRCRRCGSSPPSSAAGTARSRTRRSSRWPRSAPGSPAGRSRSCSTSRRRCSPPGPTALVVTVRTGFDRGGPHPGPRRRRRARRRRLRGQRAAGAGEGGQPQLRPVPRAEPARPRARRSTRTPSASSSYRGFGAPQGYLAGEMNLDQAAQQLRIDPVELRSRNLVRRGEELLRGKRPLDADLHADLDLADEDARAGASGRSCR